MKTLFALLILTATSHAGIINYSGSQVPFAAIGYNDTDDVITYAWSSVDYDLDLETDANGHEVRLLGTMDIYTVSGTPAIVRHYDFLDTPGQSMTQSTALFQTFAISEDGTSIEAINATTEEIYLGNKNAWTAGRNSPVNVSLFLGRAGSTAINIGTNLHPMQLDPSRPDFQRWGLMPIPFGVIPEPGSLLLAVLGVVLSFTKRCS